MVGFIGRIAQIAQQAAAPGLIKPSADKGEKGGQRQQIQWRRAGDRVRRGTLETCYEPA